MYSPNEKKPYTRDEMSALGEKLPERGALCPKCHVHIPGFSDLDDAMRYRVKSLECGGQRHLAIAELMAATGCSPTWAKLWVIHNGRPAVVTPGPPCPYCNYPLKTATARQCLKCGMDWHDPDNIKRNA